MHATDIYYASRLSFSLSLSLSFACMRRRSVPFCVLRFNVQFNVYFLQLGVSVCVCVCSSIHSATLHWHGILNIGIHAHRIKMSSPLRDQPTSAAVCARMSTDLTKMCSNSSSARDCDLHESCQSAARRSFPAKPIEISFGEF